MLATIFQLAGALILGYEFARRNKEESRTARDINGGTFDTNEKPDFGEGDGFDGLYETYTYRIGFLFLIIGYVFPLIPIKLGENLAVFPKLFLAFSGVIVLMIFGIQVSKLTADIVSRR